MNRIFKKIFTKKNNKSKKRNSVCTPNIHILKIKKVVLVQDQLKITINLNQKFIKIKQKKSKMKKKFLIFLVVIYNLVLAL